MDLTRDFIEKIEEMAGPETIYVNDLAYSHKQLYPVMPPSPDTLQTKSLSSIVDYLKGNIDQCDPEEILIHVVDEETVTVSSMLFYDRRTREVYMTADAPLPQLRLNDFIPRESFNVMLQSCFTAKGDRDSVLKVIGNISKQQSGGVEVSDDGVTQNVEAKAGTVLKTKATIPNPVNLAPFRTFTEIDQPISPFVLRINEDMRVALFTADGGAWKQEAMKNIQAYLIEALSDEDGNCPYTIIA